MNTQNEKALHHGGNRGQGFKSKSIQLNYNQNPMDLLLSRLNGVKQTSPGKYVANCPGHDDRSPSLAIREGDNGAVLLKCWAGCDFPDIVAAAGLEPSDLFPRTHGRNFDASAPRPKPQKFRAYELLETASFYARIVALAACDLAANKPLPEKDMQSLLVAADVLSEIVLEVSHV